ncbi:MAG: glycosyltransferase family 1 protein, partial [Cyanobacteriota bacterium]
MLKITIDATPIQPNASGVGLYVTNLIRSLHPLQVKEKFQLSIAYQPGLKNWLRRNISPPKSLNIDSQFHIVPIPVRISNILLSLPSNWMVS